MKFVLGLTGQTGAGKSSAQQICRDNGYFVIDCDKLYHEITVADSPIVKALGEAFTRDILNDDGSLNFKKLAEKAFASSENTQKLNDTVFPFIMAEVQKRISETNAELILLDAPTLFESNCNKLCNKTIAVLAEREIRKQRIIDRDKISDAQAESRLNAGKSDEFYLNKCDKTVYNNTSYEEFLVNFKNALGGILNG